MSTSAKGDKMSKIKEELQRIQDREYEQYISFMEWVCDQRQEVSESKGTDEVEEDLKKSSTTGTSIVPTNTLNSVNNINYNPCKGA